MHAKLSIGNHTHCIQRACFFNGVHHHSQAPRDSTHQACLISELRRVCSTCKQCPTLQPTGRRGGCAAARTHASVYPSYRAVRHGPLPRVLCISASPNLHLILLCLQGNFNPLCHIELQVSILEIWGHRLLSDRTRKGHL